MTGVTDWRPGDRVMAMARGCAELAVVDTAVAMPVPDSLDWEVAGALPVALATMHDALVTNGHVIAGDHVVVNAASSGVGVVGVRMALVARSRRRRSARRDRPTSDASWPTSSPTSGSPPSPPRTWWRWRPS